MDTMTGRAGARRPVWAGVVGGRYFFTESADLMASGADLSAVACPARCGRDIAQVTPGASATGMEFWGATCPCGARCEIFNTADLEAEEGG